MRRGHYSLHHIIDFDAHMPPIYGSITFILKSTAHIDAWLSEGCKRLNALLHYDNNAMSAFTLSCLGPRSRRGRMKPILNTPRQQHLRATGRCKKALYI